MGVADSFSVSVLQISAKVQVCDLRSKHRGTSSRGLSAHSRSRCVRIQMQAQLRSQSSVSRSQLTGHLIYSPTGRRCSASTGLNIAASFQSHSPIEHSQQLQPPVSGPKFQPFTPQVECMRCLSMPAQVRVRPSHKQSCQTCRLG